MSPKPIINLIPKIEKQLPIFLDIIEKKNIYKITNKPTNIKEILIELKANIKSKNHWATFYLVQILSERIADFMIITEKDFFKAKKISSSNGYFTIEKKIIDDKFCFADKINCLKELSSCNQYNTKDFETLIDILELLRFIRNKYMFHVTNYDEYSFIYNIRDMYKKDKSFYKNLSELVKRMKYLMNDFHKKSYEWQLLERYSSSFTRSINTNKQKNVKRTTNYTGVYEPLPGMLSRISYVFILFLGRKNLKLK